MGIAIETVLERGRAAVWELVYAAFRGFMRLIGPFMRGACEKRTRADMERFKTLLERGAL